MCDGVAVYVRLVDRRRRVGGIASLVRSIVTRSVVDEPEMDRMLSGQRKTSGRVFLHLSGSSPEVPVVFRSGGVPLMFTHLSVLHLCMILEMMLRTRRRERPPGGELWSASEE